MTDAPGQQNLFTLRQATATAMATATMTATPSAPAYREAAAEAQTPSMTLQMLDKDGRVCCQFVVMSAAARQGFLVSVQFRRWAQRLWRLQAAGQRRRDIRRVFGLNLIGPLEGEAEVKRVAREHLGGDERHRLYRLDALSEGKTWILDSADRERARELVRRSRAAAFDVLRPHGKVQIVREADVAAAREGE